MNVDAVASATRPVLVEYAAAAADNAHDLVADAEVLLGEGRHARAYALAALAVEEFGKASGILTLAVMPDELRACAPIREMLKNHLLKQVSGMLMSAVEASTPGVSTRLAGASHADLAGLFSQVAGQAGEADQAKMHGLYVDLTDDGQIRHPSEISKTETQDAVARARGVADAARILSDPEAQARFADPPPGALEMSARVFSTYLQAGNIADPEAAAIVATEMASQTRASLPPG